MTDGWTGSQVDWYDLPIMYSFYVLREEKT
jgi:hypothetical protein